MSEDIKETQETNWEYEKRPESHITLFTEMSKVANGFTNDDAINASANILLGALRQGHKNRISALMAFDKISAKMRDRLDADYGKDEGIPKNALPGSANWS